jgi:putative tricarboxylic transport membrane protein
MKTNQILKAAGLFIAMSAMAMPSAHAEFVPSKPIEIVVHNGPGSGPDVLARQLSAMIDKAGLSPVRFTVLNKTGGGATNAAAYLKSKSGDKNTIAIFTGVWVADPLLQQTATVQLSDLTPITPLVLESALIVTRADSPYKTLAEFVDAAKSKPGQLKQAGGSITSHDNIIRQQIMGKTGADWVFVSFPSGSERISALLGGHVDLFICDPSEADELARAGKVKILAQVSNKRLPGFDDVPTLREAGIDVEPFVQVRGVVGPPDMPADALAFYSDMFAKVAKTEAWAKYVKDAHVVDGYMGAAETKTFLAQYNENVKQALIAVGAKVVR